MRGYPNGKVIVTTAAATFVAESTVTDRYQTTVPDAIRRVLKLGKRDRLRYSVQPDGAVILERVSPEDAEDPVLGEFLAFLSRDIEVYPDRLKAFDGSLRERIQALVGRVEVDLEAPLSPDDE
jgi:antitoxin PrlF